jgi:type IV secretion system protein VirD4
MNRNSYSDIILSRYIKENVENSQVLLYKDISKEYKFETCLYEDLNKTEIKGFPFASDFYDGKKSIDYNEYCKLTAEEKKKYHLRYHYVPLMHELYIGTTGSGKTTTCIEPQIRAISSQKNKPNIFISDPKGEIYLHNVKHLIDNGYKVQLLNFKNIKHTNCWNPLEEIYEKQVSIPLIGKDAKFVKGNEVDHSLSLAADKSEFKNGFHIVYNDIAFPNYETFNTYVDGIKFLAHAEVTSLVNQLCSQMFPDDKMSSNDPTWQSGSREFFNGIILALLEDAINPEKHFTKEMFNIKTVNDVFTLASKYNHEDPHGNSDSEKLEQFMLGKSKETLDKLEIVVKTAPNTKKGFLSTCQSMIGKWMNGHIFGLTTETNIDLDDSKQPIALFIITRDYDKSDNAVAGLFLNWVYRRFLEKAEKAERKDGIAAGRPLHFMLDEFANIPAIPDFEIKIATSRSRNMWFHIYLQSYEQLNTVYKANVATIIIDNCNQQTFLGSQSVETKERFSRECGQKTIKSLKSSLDNNEASIVSYPVISLSTLNNIETGWMFVKRIKWDVIKSTYVRSYQCADEEIFKNFRGVCFEDFAPINLANPGKSKYQYAAVIPDRYLDDPNYYTLTREEKEDDDDDFFFGRRRRR